MKTIQTNWKTIEWDKQKEKWEAAIKGTVIKDGYFPTDTLHNTGCLAIVICKSKTTMLVGDQLWRSSSGGLDYRGRGGVIGQLGVGSWVQVTPSEV